ncbi:hypothetical protein FGB62_25g226 [Gracilaria domingensis]|nr:hypothetical protein FGB62_25g226 [Gracilaria domingensis]
MKAYRKLIAKIWGLILIFTPLGASQCIDDKPMTVSGTASCYGRPLPNSKVSLNHQIGFVVNRIGATFTDADGHFSITGNALDTSRNSASEGLLIAGSLLFFFQFDYAEPGTNERSFSVGQWEPRSIDGLQGKINLGNFKADSDSCQRYMLFYDVWQDFIRRGGSTEFRFHVSAEERITSKVPFAEWGTIRIPFGFKMTAEIAKHEFGHVIRNIFDGDKAHFEEDVEAYGGFEPHSCDEPTSLQFAFNEGWASFWAGECLTSDANGPKDIEGNVASAIRGLQVRCESGDKEMLDVLFRHPGVIHTYEEFEAAHEKLYNCP